MDDTVILLKICGDHGDVVFVCESAPVADAVLLKWVRSMWGEENGEFPEATPLYAIEEFFESSAEYYYDWDEVAIIRSGMREATWDT